MKSLLILGVVAAIAAIGLGIRAYNRAVARELAPRDATETQESTTASMPSFTDLSNQEAKDFLAEHPETTILDVRTPPECAGGILEGALLIPMQSLQGRESEIPEGPVLVYCAVGARSAAVANYLAGLGREEVYNLEGGIMGWGGPTVSP
jgi:rhodanese-related sulfurtransferase